MPGAPDYSQVILSSDTLGTVILEGFEIPQSLPLGGEQRIIVNAFIGQNKREVQTLGSQPRPLHWTGAFLYESALSRARYIDRMRLEGLPIKFQWGDFMFQAIIESFFYDPINRFEVPYEIQLQIIKQDFAPIEHQLPVPSLDTVAQGMLDTLGRIQDLLVVLKKAYVAFELLQKGDVNSIISAVDSLVGALGTTAKVIGLSTQDANELINTATIAAASARALADALSRGPLDNPVAEAVAIQSELLNVIGLLSTLTSPIFVGGLPVVRDNLFRISRQFYGQIDGVWDKLADFNNLNDAQLLGPQTVQLPPINGLVPKHNPLTEIPGTLYEASVTTIPPQGRSQR